MILINVNVLLSIKKNTDNFDSMVNGPLTLRGKNNTSDQIRSDNGLRLCLHIDASCIFLGFPVVYALVVFNRRCLALQS